MNWDEFAAAAPELAAMGRERLERTEVALLGTTRVDGSARISPLEFLFLDGEMYVGMMWQSKKALDLIRDPRCLIHSTVSNKDGKEGEFKLRGRMIDVQDPSIRERIGQESLRATGWRPPEPYHQFVIDIEGASFVQYSEDGSQTVRRWRPGQPERTMMRKWTGSGYAPEEEL